jgi:hypothetical protein
MRRLVAGLGLVTALLTACPRLTGGDDALLIGRLFGDPVAGCVWIGGPMHGVEVDWPSFYDIDVERIRVSGPGGFVAQEGDWFRMGGGIRPDISVTPGCAATEGQDGMWDPHGIDFFGDERPPAEFGGA